MLGVILIILGIAGKIVQANEWFVIPNGIVVGLFIAGGIALTITIVANLVIAHKAKKARKEFLEKDLRIR